LLKDRDWEGAMEIRTGALRRFLDLSDDEARVLIDEAWGHHDEAWKQIETFGPGRMAAYCLEKHGIDDDESIATLTREFEEASLTNGVERVEGSLETIQVLKKNSIRIGLVCDTGFTPARVVRELLDECDLLSELEVQCFSDEVGVPKPGAEIFAKALAGLGARPPEAVHIGDLKRTDIAGARDIGMHGVRFKGVHNDATDAHEAEVVIDRHQQLLEVLGLS